MESNKLPVLWIGNPLEDHKDSEGDKYAWVADNHDRRHYKLAPIEPYIPVARVRELVEKLTRAMNAAVDTQRIDLAHRYSQRIDDLEELIADVEDV